uniref:Transmembrane protein n=1 Tax=Fagus sylvatica TaxID=28930 RepID=A0A2N9FV18_FAGSY
MVDVAVAFGDVWRLGGFLLALKYGFFWWVVRWPRRKCVIAIVWGFDFFDLAMAVADDVMCSGVAWSCCLAGWFVG